MVGCSILGCKNRSDRNRKGQDCLTFHTFPHSPVIKNKWIEATGRMGWNPTKHSKVCSHHFDSDSIIAKNNVTRIKPSAVPVINVHPAAIVDVVSCAVPGCTSSRNNNPNKYSFHQFPQNPKIRAKWLEWMGKVDWEPQNDTIICSKHFEKNCFTDKIQLRNKLSNDSVPTLFMPKHRVISLISDSSSEASETESLPEQNKNKMSLRSSSLKNKSNITKQGKTKQRKKDSKMSDSKTPKRERTECRTCLEKFDVKHLYSVFKTRKSLWDDEDYTIASDLANITGVKISSTDIYSKFMCPKCFSQLKSLQEFIARVKKCDKELKERSEISKCEDESWPKPIQLDKNVNGDVFGTVIDVDIKQEVISEEEESQDSGEYRPMLDIKVEPEEITKPQPIKVTVNGTISNDEHNTISNGEANAEQNTGKTIKLEPLSDEEELTMDLPLECMLCAKTFHSVSGLKAHVIAQHSYKTVKRKATDAPTPEKKPRLKCDICLRTFTTSTDLMVHETCHNKSVCYGCHKNFDSFAQLTKHRKYCKTIRNKEVSKPKSLEDVMRPNPSPATESPKSKPDNILKCQMCNKEFTDIYYLKIHHDVVHESSFEQVETPNYMEIETLESIFEDNDNSNESDTHKNVENKENLLNGNTTKENKDKNNDLQNDGDSAYIADESSLALKQLLNDDSVNSPSEFKNNEVLGIESNNQGNEDKVQSNNASDQVMAENEQSVINTDQAVTEHEQSIEQPINESQVTTAEEQATVNSKECSSETDLVTMESEKATVENDIATIDSKQANIETDQSTIEQDQSALESKLSLFENVHISDEISQTTNNEQTLIENDQEINQSKEATVENEQSTIETEQSNVDNEQGIVENEQGIVENEQGIVENEQDIVENEQDIVENEQDIVGNEQDIVDNEQGIVENEQGIVENEHSFVESEHTTLIDKLAMIESAQGDHEIIEYSETHIDSEKSFIDNQESHIDCEPMHIVSENVNSENIMMSP